jgi:hypothetical protein
MTEGAQFAVGVVADKELQQTAPAVNGIATRMGLERHAITCLQRQAFLGSVFLHQLMLCTSLI